MYPKQVPKNTSWLLRHRAAVVVAVVAEPADVLDALVAVDESDNDKVLPQDSAGGVVNDGVAPAVGVVLVAEMLVAATFVAAVIDGLEVSCLHSKVVEGVAADVA